MISHSIFKGIKSIILENRYLKVTFLPLYGSKMSSLINKKTKREYLFQHKEKLLKIPKPSSPFSDYDSSGFDECFPSIDKSLYPIGEHRGTVVPDHGELWSLPWEYSIEGRKILFSIKSKILPYSFKKEVWLEGNSVMTKYFVDNLSSKDDFAFIWTPHCLLNCSTKTKLIIPEKLNEIISVNHATEHLGSWGTTHKYPVTISKKTGREIDLSTTEPVTSSNEEKFYFTNKMENDNICGIYHEDTDEKLLFDYDTDKIPYLGVWKTQGGYRGDYNLALEPCTGLYDDLYMANSIKKVAKIKPQKIFNWYFNIKII